MIAYEDPADFNGRKITVCHGWLCKALLCGGLNILPRNPWRCAAGVHLLFGSKRTIRSQTTISLFRIREKKIDAVSCVHEENRQSEHDADWSQ